MLVLLCLLVLLNCSTTKAEQSEQRKTDYSWEQLIDVAQKCFNETGLRSDLISWKDRQQQKMKVIELISVGGEVILEIENAKMQLEVMQEEADVLNQAMVQEGVQGIREYYKVKKDIAKTQAILKVAQKKYEAILRACGKK
jgi:hypothetical protein